MFTQRNLYLVIFLLLALFGCGGGGEDPAPAENNSSNYTDNYTGNFLAWTGSYDASHYFTLVRVNGQTGTVTTIGGFEYFIGLAYGPDGKLYGVANDLHIINPTNGATTKIGDLIYLGTKILMNEATFAPDGRLYVAENGGDDRVFTVDLNTGALTLVGTTSSVPAMGLEFSADGTLYTVFATLYTLNPSDMSIISTIGSTGGVLIDQLTFGDEGILFGKNSYPSTNIYSLNLGTGQATAEIPVSSGGLVSLVAERTAIVYPAPQVQTSVLNGPTTFYRDIESLLIIENEVRDQYFTSK